MSKLNITLLLVCFLALSTALKAHTKPKSANQNKKAYTRLTQSAYTCPSGYHYISYNDLVSNLDHICPELGEWSISRIQGGGSVDGSGYNCRHRINDPRDAAQAVCVKTTILNKKIVKGMTCPKSYDVVSVSEASADYQDICHSIGNQDPVRIGYGGSIQNSDDGCKVKSWDDQDLSQTLCVKRDIVDVKLVNADDDLCGTGRSFLTVKEVANDQQKYCNLIPADAVDQFVQLAGGASLGGQEKNCQISYDNSRPLQYGLCSSDSRPDIDGYV